MYRQVLCFLFPVTRKSKDIMGCTANSCLYVRQPLLLNSVVEISNTHQCGRVLNLN